MENDFQSEEELQAQLGPGGPADFVVTFIAVIQAGAPLPAVMAMMTPELRREVAAAWVNANARPESVEETEPIAALSSCDTTHPLWPSFAAEALESMRKWADELDLDRYGVASRPRPVPPDYELILLVDTGGQVAIATEPTPVIAHKFLVRSRNGEWQVASFSDTPPASDGV